MEESTPISQTTNSPTDIFNEIEPSPKPEDLSFSSASSIRPAQRPPETSVSWSSQLQKKKKKTPRDHENNRVNKLAKYFKENEILPIPELVQAIEPKTVVCHNRLKDQETDRTQKKKTFEEIIKTAGIPGKYFYRKSFATWDVLLPSEEIAKMLATKKHRNEVLPASARIP